MRRLQGLVVIAAGSGFVIGLAWAGLQCAEVADTHGGQPSDSGETRDALERLRGEIEALDGVLAVEREARQDLEREVDRLRQQLAAIERIPIDEPEPAPANAGAPGPPSARFETVKLQDAGVPEEVVQRLRERHDESMLDELYLYDEAARDGWLGSGRYRGELQGLRTALREEIGDADYDRLLYAAGRPNRVVATRVLHASPAMEVGILAGDVIHSYDGHRVFDLRELKRATSEGRAGSTVSVSVRRGDQQLRFFLPRGPLGITMKPATRAPDRG